MAGGAIYPDLEGRTVLVTGGGSGIGAAIVRAFARQKSKVGFIDIADAPARALADELSGGDAAVRYVRADVTDTDALRGAIADIRAAFGPITVLVNNAAHDDRHATETVTPEYFDQRIAVNLKHQFFAAQAVLPDMKAAGGGAIVNYSSISWMTGQGGMAIYTAAKSAVIGLTRSLARDYGKDNIRANAISPGWVRTERQEKLWITPEAGSRQMDLQCLKRWLVPDDLAKFTVFLASEEAAACTSQLYVVDGGRV
ncbi:MAG: SDR family oxidoreductase [Alphaproteobacteria bacterium]|nr:SDR family oxidoreductase [Alphaproteobacteria bacterium]MCW5738895.1 SDR family oxidoreductase [Alphaproteobacteria bacterium]